MHFTLVTYECSYTGLVFEKNLKVASAACSATVVIYSRKMFMTLVPNVAAVDGIPG
jgi:hypothetical protein